MIRRWVHSLRLRLMAAFILVVLITIGTASLFVAGATLREVNRYEDNNNQLTTSRIQSLVSYYYLLNGSWTGVQSLVEQLATMQDTPILVTDSTGIVVADSQNKLIGKVYKAAAQGTPLNMAVVNRPNEPRNPAGSTSTSSGAVTNFGSLYITYPSTSLMTVFVSSTINRFLIWGGLLAIAIAIIITFFFSQRITSPIRTLSRTAKLLGKGDFSQRVYIKSRDEVGELAETFNTMASDLERTEKLRKNMVADVAHELRTPLTNVSGYLEAIKDGVVQPDAATIASLSEETALLSHLVDDLQELALSDAGELKLNRQLEDIRPLIEQSIKMVQVKAQSKNLEIKAELEDSLPPVNIDYYRLSEVLRNLLTNAIKHTPEGGKITIIAKEETNSLKIDVVDTGEGIPASELPNLFERFYRVDKSRARTGGGSGLGLSIAKRIVEGHGGTIGVLSEEGQGSDFFFSLPLDRTAAS